MTIFELLYNKLNKQNMLNIITSAHSGLRYILLILLILAIVDSYSKKSEVSFEKRGLALGTLIITHIQVLLGFILYFISPKVQFVSEMMKDSVLRFYGVEHITGMLIAVILITIGFSKAKKKGYKSIFVYYLAALILILVSIPWPFRILDGSWI